MSGGAQVFVYPEELEHVAPKALCAQVRSLGCDGVSMALSYHRGRRVFPRHQRVSVLTGRTLYFEPQYARYGMIRPPAPDSRAHAERVLRFRDACATADLTFRAWIVALHDERLAASHPGESAQLLDGSPAGHSLCPSAHESITYTTALAGDVASKLEPDAVDLEAALYPAWEPSYTLTLSLEPMSANARLLGSQCFCSSCRELLGPAAEELEARAKRAAGPPFADHAQDDEAIADELARVRAVGVGRLIRTVAASVHFEGSRLRVFVPGPREQAALQGASAESLAAADELLFGCGPLRGDELAARFADARALTGRSGAVSTNWSPERSPDEYAADATRLAAAGAEGLALYNLTLVPDAGLEAFRAAAAAFRTAVAA
jgi:hypothetical protein